MCLFHKGVREGIEVLAGGSRVSSSSQYPQLTYIFHVRQIHRFLGLGCGRLHCSAHIDSHHHFAMLLGTSVWQQSSVFLPGRQEVLTWQESLDGLLIVSSDLNTQARSDSCAHTRERLQRGPASASVPRVTAQWTQVSFPCFVNIA